MSENKTWTIDVELEEDPDHTDAKVTLRIGDKEHGGWGQIGRAHV
jgi:hypothetical protein